MAKLVVKVIGTATDSGIESTLSLIESSLYSPDILEQLVCSTIDQASKKGLAGFSDIEVSISLTPNDDKTVRPSLHLSLNTIDKLSSIGAAFDFDPYL